MSFATSLLAENPGKKQSQAADLYHTCDAATAPAVLIAAVTHDVLPDETIVLSVAIKG
jgi:hypothetical protein